MSKKKKGKSIENKELTSVSEEEMDTTKSAEKDAEPEVVTEDEKSEEKEESEEEKPEEIEESEEEKPEGKEESEEEKPEEKEESKEEKEESKEEKEESKEEKPEEKEESKEEKEESKEEKEESKEEKPEEKEESKEEKEESKEEKEESKEEKEKTEEEKPEEKKNGLYIDAPFIDPSLYAHRRKKRVVKTVVISVVSFLAIVYLAGLFYFSGHFSSKTSVNGMDVSYKSVSDVEEILLADAENYTLTVEFKNKDYEVKLGDGNTKACLAEPTSSILKKNSPFLWFVDIFKEYEYKMDYTVTYEEETLQDYLNQCECMDEASMVGPTNAEVKLENGEVVVVPEETGTLLDKNLVYEKVGYALTNYLDRVNLEDMSCYVRAQITTESESIVKAQEAAKAYLEIKACYDFGDYVYQIPKEELCTMAYVSGDGTIKISKNNVIGYVNRFAARFSTAETERQFKTHDNKVFKIYGGYYGWVIDTEAEAEELYDYMLRKTDFTKEPVCVRRGYTMCEMNDIGENYVEVDLTNQHVYVYKNGRLRVDTDCVSGHTPGHKTPGGLYGITYKKLHAVLRGEDYETPVTYWMPFNGGIGLHDANWRGKFGGDIYTIDGSHGCVNLPTDVAAEIFDLVEEGMPVVCYWRDEVEEVK